MQSSVPHRPPWQFSVTTMLVVVGLLALGFSLGKLPLGHAGLMIIVLVLLIAVHVIGNALGMYLRDQSPLHRQQEPLPLHARPLHQMPVRLSSEVPTHMQQRSYSGWWVIASLLIGCVGGGIGGARLFWSWYDQARSSWLLGTISAAVIGGIFSFILSSFLVMSYLAWREATREDVSYPEVPAKEK
jgi:hypothetical protein